MRHFDSQSRWRQPISLLFAVLGACLGVLLLVWSVYRWTDDPATSVIRLQADALEIVQGEGRHTDAGVSLTASGPNGLTLVQGAIRPFQAKRYGRLAWRLDGLPDTQALRVIWATSATIRRPFDRIVSTAERRAGSLDLSTDPNWNGLIVGVGLAVVGSLSEPILLNEVSLRPTPPRVSEILPMVWRDWIRDTGWTGRSINFTNAADGQVRLKPLVLVVVWCGLACGVYLALTPPWRRPLHLAPYAVILLLGWLMLDARWQWLLSQRLEKTHALYAGLDATERQQVGWDRRLFPFLSEIRRQLKTEVARIFILSSDPGGYRASRARYHLLPHNTYLTSTLDRGMHLRSGDYVLMLAPLDASSYDPKQSMLSFGEYRVPVSLEWSTPGQGALFKVVEGKG